MPEIASFSVDTKLDMTKSSYEKRVERAQRLANPKPWWTKLPFFSSPTPRLAAVDDSARQKEIETRLAKWYEHSPPDRLSPAEIEDFSNAWSWEELAKHRDERKSSYAERPIETTFQGMLFPMIRKVMQLDPNLKSMLAIGCRYAYDLHLIGKEYPALHLSGVDLHVGLDRLNEEFPEITIHQGYALEMLERGEIGADICTFVSTATCFKPREMDAYFTALAKQSKYVILNELVDQLPSGRVPNPGTIEDSVPSLYKGSSDQTVHFIHNYKASAERAGFKVLHHRAYKPDWTDVYRLEMVATTVR